MRRSMRIRGGICMLLAVCAAAGLLWGCSERRVDYGLDSEAGRADGANSLEELAGTDRWKDEWELDMGNGRSLNLVIDAAISVPEAEHMSVVEVEKLKLDGAAKKQLMDAFFGGTEIYYHDAAHMTKEELEARIEGQKMIIELAEDEWDRMRNYAETGVVAISEEELEMAKEGLERQEEKLSEYEAALEDAPEGLVLAEEYESCGEFIAYVDEIEYYIYFPEDGEEAVIRIQPSRRDSAASAYIPEALEELKEYDSVYYGGDSGDESANACPLSKEKAQELADRFIQSSGIADQILLSGDNLVWMGERVDDNGVVTEWSPGYAYGYSFVYGLGLNGLPLADFGDEWTYADINRSGASDFYSLDCSCSVEVTDDGVVGAELRYPLTVKHITEQVELLPLETIQSIMKNEAVEHTDRYDFTRYQYSNAMDLIYFRVRDRENADSYSYIPVWRLSQKGEYCYHPILVNAIDGSVIYTEDEL